MEAAAVGTIFPGPDGAPSLHLHATLGRGDTARTGCARPGLDVWKIFEVVILEIEGLDLARLPDAATGFTLLGRPGGCGEK
jgi:predicted DNA-binding protein with PD1-like motif